MKIVALTGFKGSGKTVVAKYLELRYGFYRVNFKHALIKELEQKFPDLLNYFLHLYGCLDYKELFDTKPDGVRALMVNYGTEVCRAQDENYWVIPWKLAVADAMMAGHKNIVVDDMRFLSEEAAVDGWQGTKIRVMCDEINGGGYHQSELQQTSIVPHYTVSAPKGKIDFLHTLVDRVMFEVLQ